MKSAAVPIFKCVRPEQPTGIRKPHTEPTSEPMDRFNPLLCTAAGNIAPFTPSRHTPGERSTVADLLELMGSALKGFDGLIDLPLPVRRLRTGETLFREGAGVESIHFVRSGTFKLFHTEQDGYEQVLGFAGLTELLGFDAVCLERHPTEAVALEDATVFVVLVRDLFALSERCPAFGRVLHMSVSNALARQCELADVMAAVSSEVRLARFLLNLSGRMAACGQSPRRLLLRMSRRDIASHLGVAHETVSRSFKVLAEWGLVEVDNRDVEVLDMARLQVFSQGTRRQIDDASRLRAVLPAALPRRAA